MLAAGLSCGLHRCGGGGAAPSPFYASPHHRMPVILSGEYVHYRSRDMAILIVLFLLSWSFSDIHGRL
jgi:hypothetical protein